MNGVHNAKKYRSAHLAKLTDQIGVYALCDLDGVPIYVGKFVDGIRSRVQRHLTSARSDIIANRQIDVWEIAFVKAWPVDGIGTIFNLEAHLFNKFDAQMPLMNGKVLQNISGEIAIPDEQVVQVIEENERQTRLDPALRLPRQIAQYLRLVDYIQVVKDADHLRRALQAHFDRLQLYHQRFLA